MGALLPAKWGACQGYFQIKYILIALEEGDDKELIRL